MSKIVKPVTTELDAKTVYKLMPPALRAKADEAKASYVKLNTGSIKVLYKLGHQIDDVLTAQDNHDTELYGTRPVDSLATYLDESAGRLYSFRNFAKAFTAEYVNAQNDDPKNRMSLKHWLIISQYEDAKERERLVMKVQKTGMSSTELALIGKGSEDKKNNRSSSGRLQKIPSSPLGAVNKLSTLLLANKNYSDQAYDFIVGGFKDVPPDELNLERTLDAYEKAIDQADDTATGLEKMRNGLSKAKAELERRIRNQKPDAVVFEDDVEPVEDEDEAPIKKSKKKKKKKSKALVA